MQPQRKISGKGIFGRGMLMGLAEVVPGVSGGTMAFITGIYAEMVTTIATFGVRSLVLLRNPRLFYSHHNLSFLLLLGGGMVVGVGVFAQLMQYLLSSYQPLVWAFFSGVILMSAGVIGRQLPAKFLVIYTPLGTVLGVSLLWLPAATGEPDALHFFLGGAVAVCAWLLPAISGSYVLLALGLYAPVIDALAGLNYEVLVSLGMGCVVGLMLFARLLGWLLRRCREPLLSLLIGFMLGSLFKLWPWQDPLQSGGWSGLLWPSDYLAGEAHIGGAIVMCLAGAFLLWLLTRFTSAK